MSEPKTSQHRDHERESGVTHDIDLSNEQPTEAAYLKIDVQPIKMEARSSYWVLIVTVLGALGSVIATALSFTQIPGKRSTVSYGTILIITGGFIVVLVAGLLSFSLYRRFRRRRMERLKDRLSGPDLRAIESFVSRELDLLSTLREGAAK